MSSASFGKFQTFLWPIQRTEYKKFFLMALIFFVISFNYNLLRAAKDSIIVTSSGAEVIPFIKVWVLLPISLLIAYLFTRISNKHTTERVFYSMVGAFLVFFAFFILVLYPHREALQPTAFVQFLQGHLPAGMYGLVALIKNWVFTLFYVIGELWGTTILSVLFWGFANEVTSIPQAKRFYPLFGVSANIATIIAGRSIISLSSIPFNTKIPFGQTSWDQSILFTLLTVIFMGLLLMLIFRSLNKRVIMQEPHSTQERAANSKIKMSMRKNFSHLFKSKYLIYIALIVLCYNITINLTEILWKNQLKLLYPQTAAYNAYMGKVFIFMGILATITALFFTGNLLRRFNWTFNALLSPIIILFTGGLFFVCLWSQNTASSIASVLHITPLALTVLLGTLQNSLARTTKYTLFDSTKEIAFIPLDRESKLNGKAAIDGVISRAGKSSGSIIYQGLLIHFITIMAITSYVAMIFLSIGIIWIISVKLLGKQFNILTAQKEEEAKEKEAKAEAATATK